MEFLPCNRPCTDPESLGRLNSIAARIGAGLTYEADIRNTILDRTRRMEREDRILYGAAYAEATAQVVAQREIQAAHAVQNVQTWQEGLISATEQVNAISCHPSSPDCPRMQAALELFADQFIEISQPELP